MIHEYYSIYIGEVFLLTRSLVVKFSDIAYAVNEGVTEQNFQVNYDEPSTWKYYLNLAGRYHESDVPMVVRSLDTLEDIPFTQENLRIHIATAKAYRWGGDEYNQLVRLYPNQIVLINGIISPVPFEEAYNAKDGAILRYDESLVEVQETNLISEIQSRINTYLLRWHNRAYCLTDDYYPPAMIAEFYLYVFNAITTVRLRNCRTDRAHSFHIREYLRSHGRLDKHFPYMTLEQQLWLYRNIDYIHRNTGKRETFDLLVDHLLTKANIPLSTYEIRHDYKRMPESIYPDITLTKKPVNMESRQLSVPDITLDQLLDKEVDLARDNARVQAEYSDLISTKMKTRSHSELPTRVYESEADDRSGSGPRLFHETLISHWVYLSTHDRYRAYIRARHPLTGEQMVMSVRDAFVLFTYCTLRSQGVDPAWVPDVNVFDVLRIPLPDRNELLRLTTPNRVPPAKVDEFRKTFTPLGEYVSTEAFHTAISQVQKEYIAAWRICGNIEALYTYGQYTQLRYAHYQNITCRLLPSKTLYRDWISSAGYDFSTMVDDDFATLGSELYNLATGEGLKRRITFSDIQKSMLELVGNLSSYSTQFLSTVSYSDFLYIGFPPIRFDNLTGKSTGTHIQARPPLVGVTEARVKGKRRFFTGNWVSDFNFSSQFKGESRVAVNVGTPVHLRTGKIGRLRMSTNNVGITRATLVGYRKEVEDDSYLPQYRYKEQPAPTLPIDYNIENGPGPHQLLAGNMNRGYFGKLSGQELVDGAELSKLVGLDEGSLVNGEIEWHKFAYKGEILFIPNMDIRTGVKRHTLISKSLLVSSADKPNKVFSKNGFSFTTRAPSVLPREAQQCRIEHLLDGSVDVSVDGHIVSANGIVNSEWTETILSLASDLTDTNVVPFPRELVDGNIKLSRLGLTEGKGRNNTFHALNEVNVEVSYPGNENLPTVKYKAVGVGGYSASRDTGRYVFSQVIDRNNEATTTEPYGWRPVVVLIR